MTRPPWQAKDHEIALDFLQDNEAEAKTAAILDTRNDITVVLPAGLPGLGMRFHGGFMMAPLLLFMASLTWGLVVLLLRAGAFNLDRILLTCVILALLYGLFKAMTLLCRNRELFPRNHFVTLSPQGAAMHFAKWQLPFCAAKTALPWSEVKSLSLDRVFFLPALFTGSAWVQALRIESRQGKILRIPFHPAHNPQGALEQALRERIREKMQAA